jgi:hypothetical protein
MGSRTEKKEYPRNPTSKTMGWAIWEIRRASRFFTECGMVSITNLPDYFEIVQGRQRFFSGENL